MQIQFGYFLPFHAGKPTVSAEQGIAKTPLYSLLNKQPARDLVLFGGKAIEARPLAEKVENHVPVVVVGGGVAGLTAMYELVGKHQVPALLLESKDYLGGNARAAASPKNVPHPAGATIFLPGGREHRRLWQELELPLTPENSLKPEIIILPTGERFTPFGTREELAEFKPSSPAAKAARQSFQQMLRDLKEIARSPRQAITVPIQNATRRALEKWGNMSFAEFLARYNPLAAKIADTYIRSDLAAPSDDVAAYAGMVDLEDLNNPRYVLPGGNGYVCNQMAAKINQTAKAQGHTESPLQIRNVVTRIEQTKNRALVQYRDPKGELHVLSADHVLMAAPYQEVPRLMKVPARVQAVMDSVRKSSYAIVNIYLNKTPVKTHQFYMLPHSKYIADLVVNTKDQTLDHKPVSVNEPSVMSIYTAYTGRKRDWEKFKAEIRKEILRYFPEIKPEMIDDIRVNPFRYAMGATAPGQMAKLRDMPRTLGRVTFINSDGGGVPSIITAVDEARNGVKTALAALPAEAFNANQNTSRNAPPVAAP
ncbi:MAG: FAD-dependent oxidoreductase [Cyanobacteria bacterium]|nr:FAD-dependent oxidoreductase [Cyanobacteriota bacterium]